MELQQAIPIVEQLQCAVPLFHQEFNAVLDRPSKVALGEAVDQLGKLIEANANTHSVMYGLLNRAERQAIDVVIAHALRKEGQQ